MNGSGNDFMDNLYDLGLKSLITKLPFLQDHLIFEYINILTLCQWINLGSAKPK
jgi:hypothetical protein